VRGEVERRAGAADGLREMVRQALHQPS